MTAERPLLGVCLGTQLLAEAAGGSAGRASEPEIGWRQVELTPEGAADPLLAPLAPAFEAFQWHSYEAAPPPDAVTLARSPVCPQAYRIGEQAWGIQFHAEVSAADAESVDRRLPQRPPTPFRVELDPRRCALRPGRRSPPRRARPRALPALPRPRGYSGSSATGVT